MAPDRRRDQIRRLMQVPIHARWRALSVETAGLEPATSCLQSTPCATR